ncbi:MAG: hypothetical protein GX552_12220, partial [Chloroflexi bacterium]|nr:hypothetical protein [Chloroflexota bacterium]
KNPCLLFTMPRENAQPVPGTDDLVRYWTDVDLTIERAMRSIDNTEYYGVAVPFHFPNLGSSSMAGVLGARMEYLDKSTIWPFPSVDSLDQLLDIRIDPPNDFYRTILEITDRSAALSHNHHYVAPFPLEGPLDNICAVYGNERTLLAMIEQPDKVYAAMNHFKVLWIEAFQQVQELIARGGNEGGIGWAGIWAPGTTFPIQEDVTYMISNEMFEAFCMPHLRDIVDAMDYAFYHLDGVRSLCHLDSLLSIEGLRGIQWVPGPGYEEVAQWYDLFRYIISKNKSVEVFAQVDEIDDLVKHVGARGLLIACHPANRQEAEQLLEKYGF